MQDVVDKAAIDRAIDTMNPVDPMSYKPVLTAYNVLQHTNARTNHIILLDVLLGDGDAEDSYSALATQIHGRHRRLCRPGRGRPRARFVRAHRPADADQHRGHQGHRAARSRAALPRASRRQVAPGCRAGDGVCSR
jgi:hypothetical protein